MLAKIWKKVGMLILIAACIFNIMLKFVKRNSFNYELQASATYVNELNEENENLTK